jgi:FkbM family methyltransferase
MLEEKNLILKKINRFKLYLDKKDTGISQTLMKGKFFKKWHREPEFMDIIESEVHEGDVAFDLGANIGYVTIHLAEYVGEKGKVYAIEPSPRNFEILTKTILVNKLEKIVKVEPYAISSRSGQRELNISDESNLNSFVKTKYTKNTIKVDTVSIDDYFTDKRFPNFIKMDIEGAEVDALAGISKILENDSCMKILMEIHPMYYDKDAFSIQLERLFKLGFYTKYLVSAGVSEPDYFKKLGYKPFKTYITGNFTRGIYKNISNEHVVESCSNLFPNQMSGLNWLSILKRPHTFFSRRVASPKIVRSIMLQRD